MKRLLWLLLLAPMLRAQVVGPGSVTYQNTAPSGDCGSGSGIVIDYVTGAAYACNNGTWGNIGGGGPPTGTASGALTGSYPGPTLSTEAATVPTGVSTPYSVTLALDAAKDGVLLDTFKQTGDADDTASLTRAVAACVPIALGARTYTVNNFNAGTSCATFILKGIKGQSIIQRTSASGGTFFGIGSATVYIDGVTFDANQSSVTANQWGVLLNQGGQNVLVQNSVFKNNSGSLGSCFSLLSTGPAAGGWFNFSNNEVTGCTFNPLFFGSVYQGVVANNYIHDNTGGGIWAGSYGTASSTNYLSDVLIAQNLIMRNTGGAGVALTGGFSIPYTYGTPGALRVNVVDNKLQDNGGASGYQLALQGDYLNAIGNQIDQSSGLPSVFGGIDCNARYEKVESNTITLSGSSYGIDCGGSIGASIARNTITMSSGTMIDAGGNLNTVVSDNVLNASGTATAMLILNVEGAGGSILGAFPSITSNLNIKRNRITMNGSGTRGISIFDNAGGGVGAYPVQIFENDFLASNGAVAPFAISYKAAAGSIQIGQNTWQGSSLAFVDPLGNGDLVVSNVFDRVDGFSSSATVRSILNDDTESYGSGGSILYIYPTSGGSGYTAATVVTVTCTGLSGWTGNAQINNGVILGVYTTAIGSGCTGTPTAVASDTGGGTGAVLVVGNIATLPSNRQMYWTPFGQQMILGGGGYVTLSPNHALFPRGQFLMVSGSAGITWNYQSFSLQSYAVGSLPTCNTAAQYAQINVTGSAVNGWLAQCDGTNWRFPNGTVVS